MAACSLSFSFHILMLPYSKLYGYLLPKNLYCCVNQNSYCRAYEADSKCKRCGWKIWGTLTVNRKKAFEWAHKWKPSALLGGSIWMRIHNYSLSFLRKFKKGRFIKMSGNWILKQEMQKPEKWKYIEK